jgi:hypothetical protein
MPAIQVDHPGLALPDRKVVLVIRSDGSMGLVVAVDRGGTRPLEDSDHLSG